MRGGGRGGGGEKEIWRRGGGNIRKSKNVDVDIVWQSDEAIRRSGILIYMNKRVCLFFFELCTVLH